MPEKSGSGKEVNGAKVKKCPGVSGAGSYAAHHDKYFQRGIDFFHYGCTALHYAVDNSQKELINFALECRANIEERDNNGWTPLLRGVYLGSETSALSELIQKGACVNVCDVRGQTPLMQAVLTNNGDSISK
ncbi:uncharacterized protein LOC142321197 [Lycorma delicatula]|uniref:uncharacterized protein LOC142321197 n=1 Tax=Lycorma delicatula TaxID=130591 RepID=UPI003F51A462